MLRRDIENFFRIIRAFDKYHYEMDLTGDRSHYSMIRWEAQEKAVPFFGICLEVTKDLREFITNLGYTLDASETELGFLPGQGHVPCYKIRYENVLPGSLTVEIEIIPKYFWKNKAGAASIAYEPAYNIWIQRPTLSRLEQVIQDETQEWSVAQTLETPDRWCKIEVE